MVKGELSSRRAGIAILELVVALGVLVTVMLPMAYSVVQEQRLARAYYYRALAMEIIDGEMETLVAGEWRAFSKGLQRYPVRAASATNLPPGQFTLSIGEQEMRLEWKPAKAGQGGASFRAVALPLGSQEGRPLQ